MFRKAGYRVLISMNMNAPFTTLNADRNMIDVREDFFGDPMTSWLIDVAELLKSAWCETHDQRMITLLMLIAWHEHYNTRGEVAHNAYIMTVSLWHILEHSYKDLHVISIFVWVMAVSQTADSLRKQNAKTPSTEMVKTVYRIRRRIIQTTLQRSILFSELFSPNLLCQRDFILKKLRD